MPKKYVPVAQRKALQQALKAQGIQPATAPEEPSPASSPSPLSSQSSEPAPPPQSEGVDGWDETAPAEPPTSVGFSAPPPPVLNRARLGSNTYFVRLPSPHAGEYERQAEEQGVEVESVLEDRLAKAVRWTSTKPIVLSDSERIELEQLLGRNFDSAAELISRVRHALSIAVNGVEITLPFETLDRVESRVYGGETVAEVVSREVVNGLNQYVGF